MLHNHGVTLTDVQVAQSEREERRLCGVRDLAVGETVILLTSHPHHD